MVIKTVAAANALWFFTGFIEGSIQLFVQIVGPVLLAASHRKSYEITMGGTMIAICQAVPFLLGVLLGSLSIDLAFSVQAFEFRLFLFFLLSFISVLPLMVAAAQDTFEIYYGEKPSLNR